MDTKDFTRNPTFVNGRLRQGAKVAVLLPDKRVMEIGSPDSVDLNQDYNKIMTLKVTFHSYDLRTAEEILEAEKPKTKPMHESRHCPWCKENIEELLTVVPNASNCCHCGGPLDEDAEESSEDTEGSDKENELESEGSSQGKQGSDSFNIDTLMAGMDKLKEAFSKIPPQKSPSPKMQIISLDGQPSSGEIFIVGANEVEYGGKTGIPRITLDKDGKQVFGSYDKD